MDLSPDVVTLLEQPVFGHLATVQPDGSPQVTAVWLHHRDGMVMFNTAEGRAKTRNLARDGRVAISLLDPTDPYRNVTIRGRVAVTTTEGGDADIDFLAAKYLGAPSYPFRREGEVRVTVLIAAEHVTG